MSKRTNLVFIVIVLSLMVITSTISSETPLQAYEKAAIQEDASAQVILGFLYDKGQGVTQSYSTCYVFSSLGTAGGADSTIRDACEKELTPEQLSLAQEEASTLFEKISANSQK